MVILITQFPSETSGKTASEAIISSPLVINLREPLISSFVLVFTITAVVSFVILETSTGTEKSTFSLSATKRFAGKSSITGFMALITVKSCQSLSEASLPKKSNA